GSDREFAAAAEVWLGERGLSGITVVTPSGFDERYIDRLASEIWGSDREFAAAAEVWLGERGLSGITVVTPSGFDER
ncbi:hypothetical protein CTI14_69660, partial [Methylobacterium radiotolerans]